MSNKIVIPIKYWYLMGMSRCENLCLPQLLFGSNTILIHINTSIVLSRYESFCRIYIDPDGIENKKKSPIPTPYWYQKVWYPHYRCPNGIRKDVTSPTLMHTPLVKEKKSRVLSPYNNMKQDSQSEDFLIKETNHMWPFTSRYQILS